MMDIPSYLVIGVLILAILLPLYILVKKFMGSQGAPQSRDAGKLYCSFCGKSKEEVKKLIAGANVFICNECVDLCFKINSEKIPRPLGAFSKSPMQGEADDKRRVADRLEKRLAGLKGSFVTVSDSGTDGEPGQAGIVMTFFGGTKVQANYWRIVEDSRQLFSSFDHMQIYGLPDRINAREQLRYRIQDKQLVDAYLDDVTGDLLFTFTENLKLTAFNLTGYEVWEITYPEGSADYSTSFR